MITQSSHTNPTPPGIAHPYMGNLREFETTFVARYLTTHEKLLVAGLLNKNWAKLVTKHYAWSCAPILKHSFQMTKFLRSLTNIRGIHFPSLDVSLLGWMSKEMRLALESVNLAEIKGVGDFRVFSKKVNNPINIEKVKGITC